MYLKLSNKKKKKKKKKEIIKRRKINGSFKITLLKSVHRGTLSVHWYIVQII